MTQEELETKVLEIEEKNRVLLEENKTLKDKQKELTTQNEKLIEHNNQLFSRLTAQPVDVEKKEEKKTDDEQFAEDVYKILGIKGE